MAENSCHLGLNCTSSGRPPYWYPVNFSPAVLASSVSVNWTMPSPLDRVPSSRISAETTFPTVSNSSTRSSFEVDHGSCLRQPRTDLHIETHVAHEDLLVRLGRLGSQAAASVGAAFSSALWTAVVGVDVVAEVPATSGCTARKATSEATSKASATPETAAAETSAAESATAAEAPAEAASGSKAPSETSTEPTTDWPVGEPVLANLQDVAKPVKSIEHFFANISMTLNIEVDLPMAARASSGVLNMTVPLPLGRPSPYMPTSARTTSPACRIRSLRSCHEACKGN